MRVNIKPEITYGTPYGWEKIEAGLELTTEEIEDAETTN